MDKKNHGTFMIVKFEVYNSSHLTVCLELFGQNCPRFFAPNERIDYDAFLAGSHAGYRVGLLDGSVVAAFGFRVQKPSGRGLVSWIMVSPEVKRQGIGSKMMEWIRQAAVSEGVSVVDIGASHLSAPFFARFGAVVLETIPDGWGPGMHRVNMEWVL